MWISGTGVSGVSTELVKLSRPHLLMIGLEETGCVGTLKPRNQAASPQLYAGRQPLFIKPLPNLDKSTI